MKENHPALSETSKDTLPQQRTDFTFERTQMAATRTYLTLLATGLGISTGGSLLTSILVGDYSKWVVVCLWTVFVLGGFSIMLGGMRRYGALAR
jgi:uncharacterized membrane protein YidH (DUF202 family)